MRADATALAEREAYEGRRVPASGTRPTIARRARSASTWSTHAGTPVYLVDPGINGTHRYSADGTRRSRKFDAPKATLMSYIIKGILNRELPWGLVLLGVMIALVLEMSGIPSLAFAVGVYLPLLVLEPDLHRRHGPLARRPAPAARSIAGAA